MARSRLLPRGLRLLSGPRPGGDPGPAVVVSGCGPGGLGIALRLARAGYRNLRWYGAGEDPHRVFCRTAPTQVRTAGYDRAARRWSLALADGTATTADLLVVAPDQATWLPSAISSARQVRPGGPVPPAGPPGEPRRAGTRAAFVSAGEPRPALAAAAAGLLVPGLADLTLYRAGPRIGLRPAAAVPFPRPRPALTATPALPTEHTRHAQHAAAAPAPRPARPPAVTPRDGGAPRPGAAPRPTDAAGVAGAAPGLAGAAPDPASAAARPASTAVALRVLPGGLLTADGALHPADTVLIGSTFTAAELVGTAAGPDARAEYCGISVVGVPGLFILYGPVAAPTLAGLSRYRRGRITVIPAGARSAPNSASAAGTSASPISRVTSRSGCSVPRATRPSRPA